MPVHNWSSVDAGMFHAFHTAWVTHLSETLNGGLLPSGYYALPEQHGGRLIADVRTLQVPPARVEGPPSIDEGGVAVADAPPRVRRKLSPAPSARAQRRTLTVRHVSGHRIVALIEIVSPGNKDRVAHVTEFVNKAESVLRQGIHLLLVELFPPAMADRLGMHGAIWERFDDEPDGPPREEPLTLASYVGGPTPEAYLEHSSFGMPLPDMPLFLTPDRYVLVPLESTYQMAWQGLPVYWREVVEHGRAAT